MAKQRYTDGMTVRVTDINNNAREGILEILSTQVYVGFPEGDGVFMKHDDFFAEQKKLRG